MGDVHDRHVQPRGRSASRAVRRFAALGVDHGGGLVGDEQAGPASQSGGHRQALQLTAGESRRLPLIHAGQPDRVEQTRHVDAGGVVETPHDVVGDPHPEDLGFGVLHHHRRAACPAQAGAPGPADLPGSRRPAGQDASQGGFSRAVVAEQRDQLACSQIERHAAKGVGPCPRVAVAHVPQAGPAAGPPDPRSLATQPVDRPDPREPVEDGAEEGPGQHGETRRCPRSRSR